MAGQAGWYRAPGEEGLLRYWNGTIWTDHRQPDPAAASTVEPAETVPEPAAQPTVAEVVVEAPAENSDPMAEYERQFDKPASSDYDLPKFELPKFDFDPAPFETVAPSTDGSTPVGDSIAPLSTPQPQYRPQAALTQTPAPAPTPSPQFAGQAASVPRSFAPRPAAIEPESLGPIAMPAADATAPTVAEPESELEQLLRETSYLENAPAPQLVEEAEVVPVSAPIGLVVVPPNRKRVVGAALAMAAAILVILLGVGATALFSSLGGAGSGEVKTSGIVTSLGAKTATSCTPVARFAVAGKSFTANSSQSISPCPVGLGQGVDIIYSAKDPASAAHIQLGGGFTQYLWLVPVLGVLFFLGAFITFIVRAGSIVNGIALIRKGKRHDEEPVSAE